MGRIQLRSYLTLTIASGQYNDGQQQRVAGACREKDYIMVHGPVRLHSIAPAGNVLGLSCVHRLLKKDFVPCPCLDRSPTSLREHIPACCCYLCCPTANCFSCYLKSHGNSNVQLSFPSRGDQSIRVLNCVIWLHRDPLRKVAPAWFHCRVVNARRCRLQCALASSSTLLTPLSTRSCSTASHKILQRFDAALHMQITSNTVLGIGTSVLEREELVASKKPSIQRRPQTTLHMSSYGLTRCGPVVEQASLHSACGLWSMADRPTLRWPEL